MKWVNRFFRFPFFIQVVWVLCVLGVLLNSVMLVRSLASHSLMWRLHSCFLLLYAAQAVFIWLREPFTCVLTLVQGVLALLTGSDFIFFPVLKVAGICWYTVFDPSVTTLKASEYVFVSLAFTLQLYSAYAVWLAFYRPPRR